MNQSPFLNRRVIAFLLMFSSIIVLLCFVFYTIGQPKFNAVATATKARASEIAQTATSNSLIVTQQVQGTLFSQSQTQTAVPTATATITPSPVLSGCLVEINPGSSIYQGPSVALSSELINSSQVTMLAEAQNLDWYKISGDQGFSWIQGKSFKKNDCNIPSYSLSFLTGWSINRNIVLEENFSAINDWVYKPSNEPISPNGFPGADFQVLEIGKAQQNTQVSLMKPFGYLNDFSLYISFVWVRNGNIGVRFWDNGSKFYDVLIDPTCEFEISDSGQLLVKRQILTNQKCFNVEGATTTNYLELKVKNNNLSLKLNEANPIVYTLQNSYTGDGISLITKNSIVDMEFFVLTTEGR